MTKQEESNMERTFLEILMKRKEDGSISCHIDFMPKDPYEELAIIKYLQKQIQEITKL